MTVKDLAIAIAEATGYKGKIRWDKTKPDGTPRKILDVSRINKARWSKNLTRGGLERTIREYADRETRKEKRLRIREYTKQEKSIKKGERIY